MRFFIAALLACMVLGLGVAWAASAYDDVPRDHWAYNALDYLTERGVLEGYPDGFFKGDRTLTRYEFAQAIARLLDTIDTGNSDEQIRIMAETLRAEFSDQLAELGRQISDMNTAINDMDARVGNLEGAVADNTSRLGDLENKVAGLHAGPNWTGQFRYRWENWDQGDINQFRQRIQFEMGFNKMLNDATELGVRFKTNTGLDPTDGNHTLSNQFRTADIWLDRAYIKYSPSWFGYYSDCNHCEPDRDECGNCVSSCNKCGQKDCTTCIPKLDIYAGIFPNITYDPNEMIMDDDVNMHGAGIVYHFNEDFQILTLASAAVDVATNDYFSDDAYFFACEAKYDNILFCGLDAWVGCYNWQGENLLSGVYADNMIHNFDFNNDGVIDGNDRFTPNFHTLKGGLQYTWECTFDKPLSVYGEYMINVDSDAEDRINAVNPYVDPDIIYETTDDTGFCVGAQYGKDLKYCGDWLAFARYKEVGANAVIDGFADADTFGANSNSLEVNWAYRWADNADFGITYFLNKVNNAFGFLLPVEDQSKFQIDWTFHF